MKKSCFICGKKMDALHLLVGTQVYCSQDCWEEHKNKELKEGLFRLLDSACVLKDASLGDKEVQGAVNTISKAQEMLSPEKTLSQNLKSLKELGKI